MVRRNCGISKCYNTTSSTKNVSFYAVEKRSSENQQKWLAVIQPEVIASTKKANICVCSNHFKESDFINPSQKARGIREFAVPSLNLGDVEIPASAGEYEVDSPEIFFDDDIPVGKVVEIGHIEGVRKRKADEVPLIDRKRKKKKRRLETTVEADHDYACTLTKYKQALKTIEILMSRNQRLRSKTYKQAQIIKRKSDSIARWKRKAKFYQKRKTRLTTRVNDSLLSELQRNAARPLKGARYSAKMKGIALRIYYCSTRAYKELRSIFRLPSISLIKKWLRNLKIDEGFNPNIQTLLREKAKSLTLSQRVVSISLDEMSLRPNLTYMGKSKPDVILGFPTKLPGCDFQSDVAASSVLVLMVKGLQLRFKQSVAYFFSKNGFKADELKDIVRDTINFVEQTGLIPKAMVCDQNATNRSMYTKLGSTTEKPYFDHNNSRIYTFFDPPHLLKSSRNNLISHNGVYNGKIIKWDHLFKLHEVDSVRLPRAARYLSKDHVKLLPFTEMRVGIAAQTLSASVASGLRLYCNTGVIKEDCHGTAQYAADIDAIFDIFNATRGNHKIDKHYLHPLTKNSLHWSKLEEIESRLKNLRFIDKACESLDKENQFKALPKQSRQPWFISGWLQNINAVKLLFEDLTENFDFEELLTRSVNQDGLENFFGVIRMANGANNRPDVFSFRTAYRSAAVNQIMEISKKSNSERDSGMSLLSASDFPRIELETPKQRFETESTFMNMDLEEFDEAQLNNVNYTAGWITSTIHHEECQHNLRQDQQSQNNALSQLKQSKNQSVSRQLELFLTRIVSLFSNMFDTLLRQSPVGLKKAIMDVILKNETTDVICSECKIQVCEKYLNMLVKGKITSMNEQFKKKRKSAKRVKTSGTEKARKLNIV